LKFDHLNQKAETTTKTTKPRNYSNVEDGYRTN
jgi:hypothetical protein